MQANLKPTSTVPAILSTTYSKWLKTLNYVEYPVRCEFDQIRKNFYREKIEQFNNDKSSQTNNVTITYITQTFASNLFKCSS